MINQDPIKNKLNELGANYTELSDQVIFDDVASLIKDNKVVGWFSGRMEFGPRALGNRAIIGNPLDSKMQKTMNLRIKYRESFRPFARAIKADKVSEWLE